MRNYFFMRSLVFIHYLMVYILHFIYFWPSSAVDITRAVLSPSFCDCRIWIRTPGRYCQSFMVFTASSAAAPPSVWWWWTTCCHVPWRCTTSTIWRAPLTSAAPRVKSAPSPRPRSKTWTFRRCMRACTLTLTPTMPWWRPCRGIVWYVPAKTLSNGEIECLGVLVIFQLKG